MDLILQKVVIIAVVGPVCEELIFRLPLIFTKRNLLIAIVLLVFLLNKSDIPRAIVLSIVIIGVGLFLLYYKKFRITEFLENVWKNHYTFVFYIFVLLFACIHITNYRDLSFIQYCLTPLIVVPQLIMGIFFGYTRVRYKNGLIISIFMHICLNSLSLLFAFRLNPDS
ncbi:type II CAAX prenyl endopeptidase Rce1 family protein [Dysgonomonas sp. 521]|uniref:CPBP family glutamic-type intramembrane protease n=1 Tax=Dysgonomonas sp. 521 TaxID=2302932 RepID=UPI00351B204C